MSSASIVGSDSLKRKCEKENDPRPMKKSSENSSSELEMNSSSEFEVVAGKDVKSGLQIAASASTFKSDSQPAASASTSNLPIPETSIFTAEDHAKFAELREAENKDLQFRLCEAWLAVQKRRADTEEAEKNEKFWTSEAHLIAASQDLAISECAIRRLPVHPNRAAGTGILSLESKIAAANLQRSGCRISIETLTIVIKWLQTYAAVWTPKDNYGSDKYFDRMCMQKKVAILSLSKFSPYPTKAKSLTGVVAAIQLYDGLDADRRSLFVQFRQEWTGLCFRVDLKTTKEVGGEIYDLVNGKTKAKEDTNPIPIAAAILTTTASASAAASTPPPLLD